MTNYPPAHKRASWRRTRRLAAWLSVHAVDVTAVLAALNLGATVAALALLAGAP